jgi:tripartite-type tricarboxylate transporter receptor subunit TctC
MSRIDRVSRRATILGLLASVALPGTRARAQAYPNRPITIVSTVPAGGSIDAVARLLANGLSKALGQSVIVEAKPGAGGNLAAGFVAKAAPDGHTLLIGNSSTLTTNPYMYRSLPFDSAKSFAPIIIPARTNQILVTSPKVPAKTLDEFIALMRAKPGAFNYGSSGVGAASHVGAEIFALQTGTKATHVPYRGIAPAVTDLIAGQVDFVFDSATTVQHVQSGTLRALAVAGPDRIAALPDVKTFKELGVNDMELVNSWYAIAAPAATPPEIIRALNTEFTKILKVPATMDAIRGMGLEPATSTPEDMKAIWLDDLERLGAVVKQMKLEPQ